MVDLRAAWLASRVREGPGLVTPLLTATAAAITTTSPTTTSAGDTSNAKGYDIYPYSNL